MDIAAATAPLAVAVITGWSLLSLHVEMPATFAQGCCCCFHFSMMQLLPLSLCTAVMLLP